ncbi:MAG: acyltransferase [Clostridiales bacterium]|jgi:surface polysaccharide O-acyltransferase-like enzyme|nr:acyltransferase [Clostridiales bacterium]
MRKREANIEIMRILLFLMMICLHVVSPYRQTHHEKFTFSWQFTAALASVSRLCTNGFVLISGYFFTSAKNKSPLSPAFKLLLPLAAYVPFYFFLDLHVGFNEALGRVIQGLLSNENHFYHMWYLQVFLVLTLIAPLLAAGLENASRLVHKYAMIGLLFSASALPTFTYLTGLNWFDLRLFDGNLLLFIGLFVTGAYIRKYPPRITARFAGILFAASELAVVLGAVLYNTRYSPVFIIQMFNGQLASLADAAWIETEGLSGAFVDAREIFVVAASAAMLICFAKLRTRDGLFSHVITRISRRLYGAYIIHVFWIQVFSNINGSYFNLYSRIWPAKPSYPLYIFGYIGAVAVCSLLTDWLLSIAYKFIVRFAQKKLLGSEN